MPQVSNFTNSNGVRRLSSLFCETCKYSGDRETAVYTLKDYDYRDWKSLYLLYMGCNDPTEYTFANKYLADWTHWEYLCKAQWFKPYVERWRYELELSIKSAALSQLINESSKPTREGLSSAKYLLTNGWMNDKQTKGRPSKEDIRQSAHQIAEKKSDIQDHMTRLGLLERDSSAVVGN